MNRMSETMKVTPGDSASPWHELAARVLDDHRLTADEGLAMLRSGDDELLDLLAAAYRVRHRWFGNRVNLNFLINAKSGLCGEDCGYCSQSRVSQAEIPRYHLVTAEEILDGARIAAERNAKTYCAVISGRSPSDQELDTLSQVVPEVKAAYGLKICFSVGLLSVEQARRLKAAGVDRINHNLNTSERFYPQICTTHSYQDRLDTLASRAAGRAGNLLRRDRGHGRGRRRRGRIGPAAGPVAGRGRADQFPAADSRHSGWKQVPPAQSPLLPEGPGPVPAGQSALRTADRRRPRAAPRPAATAGPVCGQFDFRGRLPDHRGQPPEEDCRMIEALGFTIAR